MLTSMVQGCSSVAADCCKRRDGISSTCTRHPRHEQHPQPATWQQEFGRRKVTLGAPASLATSGEVGEHSPHRLLFFSWQ